MKEFTISLNLKVSKGNGSVVKKKKKKIHRMQKTWVQFLRQ